jgi:vancomycin aglycone glucosyltransferase
MADENGKENNHSLPLLQYSAPGGLGKPRVLPHNRRPKRRNPRNGSDEMRMLLSTYRSRGDVEPMVGLAVQSRALDAEARVCVPTGGWR